MGWVVGVWVWVLVWVVDCHESLAAEPGLDRVSPRSLDAALVHGFHRRQRTLGALPNPVENGGPLGLGHVQAGAAMEPVGRAGAAQGGAGLRVDSAQVCTQARAQAWSRCRP